MAATSLGRLTLDLVAQIGEFVGPMDKAERKAKDSTGKMNKAFADFKNQMNQSLSGTQFGSGSWWFDNTGDRNSKSKC